LVTENRGTLTEAPVILNYIADLAPDHRLLPPVGAFERYEALRWMAFISSTVHPAIGRLWRAERFCDTDACRGSVEHAAAVQLANDFAHIEEHMAHREWVAGDQLTVADFHLFVFGRLGLRLPANTRGFPGLYRHTLQIANLPATQRAMTRQGIDLEGPASGPG
jgi:glutathione S-transferase